MHFDTLRSWLQRRQGDKKGNIPEIWAVLPIALASIYGGYFGAGLGVIELAILGLFLKDNLTRLNALKQLLSLVVNVAASWFFLFSNHTASTFKFGSGFGGLPFPDNMWMIFVVTSVGSDRLVVSPSSSELWLREKPHFCCQRDLGIYLAWVPVVESNSSNCCSTFSDGLKYIMSST